MSPKRKKKPKKSVINNNNINNNKSISVEEQDNSIRKIFHLENDEELPYVSPETLIIYYKYLNEELLLPFDAEYSDDFGFMNDDIYQVSIKK